MSKQKSDKLINSKTTQYAEVPGLALLALIYLRFGLGAVELRFWALAITSMIATTVLIIGGVKVLQKKPASLIVFVGTLLVFITHIPITMFGKDESPIFLILLAVTPTIAGINLLLKTRS